MPGQSQSTFRFGNFCVTCDKHALYLDGAEIDLKPKTFQLLLYLVSNPGRLITKEELLRAVWPESFVEESNLAQQIFRLRKALEIAPEAATYIRTLPGLGYQFTAEVVADDPARTAAAGLEGTDSSLLPPGGQYAGKDPVLSQPAPDSRRLPALLAGAVLLILVTAGFAAWKLRRPQRRAHHEIVLADFDNQTGDATFDTVLKTALSVDLRQSPELTLLGSADIADTLQRMLRPATEPLKGATAVEVCRRNNDQAVLSGTVARLDKSYLITLEATDCDSGRSFAAVEAHAAGKDDVVETLDQLGSKMRLQLGESLASVKEYSVPLARSTTQSLDALMAFSQGNNLDFVASIPYYERALQLDPRFAMAWEKLGVSNGEMGNLATSRAAYIKAYELRETATARDRFWISARYNLNVVNSLEDARRNFELFVRSYPTDEVAWASLADTLREMGRYPDALQAALQAKRLNPLNVFVLLELAKSYQALGHFSEARAICREGLALHHDDPAMHQILMVLDFALHDQAGYDAELAVSRGGDRWFQMLTQQAQALATLGRMRESHRFFDMARADAREHGVKDFPHIDDAEESLFQALLGYPAQARALAAQVPPNMEDVSVEAAMGAALANDGEYTQGMIRFLSAESNEESDQTTLYWVPLLRAALALKEGNAARASGLASTATVFAAREYWVWTLLGQAALNSGRPQEAATQFEKILGNPGIDPISPMLPLAHLGLARAHRMQHQDDQARHEYEELFAYWKDADPTLPILMTAREECRQLLKSPVRSLPGTVSQVRNKM